MLGEKNLTVTKNEQPFVMNPKTTVGQINDTSCIVMLYDVDMNGLQQLMSSDYLKRLTEELRIVNQEMHSFQPREA